MFSKRTSTSSSSSFSQIPTNSETDNRKRKIPQETPKQTEKSPRKYYNDNLKLPGDTLYNKTQKFKHRFKYCFNEDLDQPAFGIKQYDFKTGYWGHYHSYKKIFKENGQYSYNTDTGSGPLPLIGNDNITTIDNQLYVEIWNKHTLHERKRREREKKKNAKITQNDSHQSTDDQSYERSQTKKTDIFWKNTMQQISELRQFNIFQPAAPNHEDQQKASETLTLILPSNTPGHSSRQGG